MAKDLGLAAQALESTGVVAELGGRAARDLPAVRGRPGWGTGLLGDHRRDPGEQRPDEDRFEGQAVTEYETILVTRQGRVGIITLNRPRGPQRAERRS